MRALRKVAPGPGLELVDIPEPVCGEKDVKIRVLRAGLCGTDLHLYDDDDWAASAMQVPQDVEHVSVGDRVSGEGHVVCGHCRNCRAGRKHMCIHTIGVGVNRDGAFADYVVIPATNAWVQPGELDPDLPTVTYCNKGVSGNAGQNILLRSGFGSVANLSGGNKNYQAYLRSSARVTA